MAKVKWGGIIKDVSEFQRGILPENAVKMEMPGSVGEMMTRALPFAIPSIMILCMTMFVKTRLSRAVIIDPVFILPGFAVGFLLLLVHELLHAAVYPSGAEITVGIMPKQLAAVALVSYPLSRGRFAFMSLIPLVLGAVPLAVFAVSPPETRAFNGFMFGVSIMGMTSVYPDIYNVYQVIKQVPKGSNVQFCGDDMYWFSDR